MNLLSGVFKNNDNNYAEEYYDEEGDGEYEDKESAIDGSAANTQFVTCIIICIVYRIIFTHILKIISM